MDTLALLCNLHADGPETLQLLRRAGWDTLADVECVAAPALASALSISQERATRFQREARHLRARLEGSEDAKGEGALEARRIAVVPKRGAARRSAHEARGAEVDEAEEPELELPARDILIPHPSVVPAPPAPLSKASRPPAVSRPPRPTLPTLVSLPTPESVTHFVSLPTVSHPPAALRSPLAPHAIDGLDASVCEALASVGIASLAELANALPLELATATGIDYTRLLRLQFLARRRAAPVEPRGTTSEPSRKAPTDNDETEDAAGPFA